MTPQRDLQEVVDELEKRLVRSVAIDDPELRLLVYGPHHGPVDDVRLGSILHRVTDEQAADHARSLGLDRATGPVRVEASDALGSLSRLCVPIRYGGARLGFLWIIDPDESLTAAETAIAVRAAEDAGAVLHRANLLRELEQAHERELVRELLLAPEAAMRQLAAARILEEELLLPGSVVVLVVATEISDRESRSALDEALGAAVRRLTRGQALHLLRHDHGLVLLSATGRLATAEAQQEIATAVRDRVVGRLGRVGPPRPVLVGVGEPQPGLTTAVTSYEQAVLGAHVARHVPSVGDAVLWADLGVYRTLARLPADRLTIDALDPAFTRLVEADYEDGALVRTLETYLDLACHAGRTAEALRVHKTSVYYRLGRIETITRLSLDDGNSRLALHLAIKIARLAGVDIGA